MVARTDLLVRNYPAYHAMAPHSHDTASLNIVLGGGFMEQIGRAERHYLRGHAAYLPAGMTHSQRFGAEATRQIIFRPEETWLNALTECGTKLSDAPHLNHVTFGHLGERLLREICAPDDLSALASEGILLEIVAAFGREAARRSLKPPAWLLRVRELLHAHAFSSLRMADIARSAERHEVHVAREFRRFYGLSIGAYLRKLRIESAALRLADRGADISDVALDCGFSSHSHLCREFKRRFGVTPSQYRTRSA